MFMLLQVGAGIKPARKVFYLSVLAVRVLAVHENWYRMHTGCWKRKTPVKRGDSDAEGGI
jgi:hypothetical protein